MPLVLQGPPTCAQRFGRRAPNLSVWAQASGGAGAGARLGAPASTLRWGSDAGAGAAEVAALPGDAAGAAGASGESGETVLLVDADNCIPILKAVEEWGAKPGLPRGTRREIHLFCGRHLEDKAPARPGRGARGAHAPRRT